jgi:ankyrin repeat protein
LKGRHLAPLLLLLAGCGGERVNLIEAAGRGDVAAVQRALADGAGVNGRDARDRTAVTAAALGDHVEVVRVLIAAGADVDLQDADRNNPLLVTGETGSVAMLREVLRASPDLGATNRYGGVAGIPASDRGHVDYVREIVKTDIDVDHVNDLGWTALLETVLLGDGDAAHVEILRILLAAGADRSIADRDGVTALEHARARGYDEMVAVLDD